MYVQKWLAPGWRCNNARWITIPLIVRAAKFAIATMDRSKCEKLRNTMGGNPSKDGCNFLWIAEYAGGRKERIQGPGKTVVVKSEIAQKVLQIDRRIYVVRRARRTCSKYCFESGALYMQESSKAWITWFDFYSCTYVISVNLNYRYCS